jgi:hypothetical protein
MLIHRNTTVSGGLVVSWHGEEVCIGMEKVSKAKRVIHCTGIFDFDQVLKYMQIKHWLGIVSYPLALFWVAQKLL